MVTLVGAGLAQLPAALAMAGFVVLVFGGLPRLSVDAGLGRAGDRITFGLLGDVFGLPQSVRDLSPFSHVPAIPAVARHGGADRGAGGGGGCADGSRDRPVPAP